MRKILLIVLAFILFLPVTFANFFYNQSGGQNNLYYGGNSLFNADLTEENALVTIETIDNPIKVPLITEMNGNNIKEIVVLDGRNLLLYQNSSLDLADTLQLSSNPNVERFSNMIAYDIDNDNLNEIILAEEEYLQNIYIIN